MKVGATATARQDLGDRALPSIEPGQSCFVQRSPAFRRGDRRPVAMSGSRWATRAITVVAIGDRMAACIAVIRRRNRCRAARRTVRRVGHDDDIWVGGNVGAGLGCVQWRRVEQWPIWPTPAPRHDGRRLGVSTRPAAILSGKVARCDAYRNVAVWQCCRSGVRARPRLAAPRLAAFCIGGCDPDCSHGAQYGNHQCPAGTLAHDPPLSRPPLETGACPI